MKTRMLGLTLALLMAYPTQAEPNKSFSKTLNFLADNKIQYIDFVFSDLHGNLKEVTVPSSDATKSFLDGLPFDGSSVPGCTSIFESDMLLLPDASTMRTIPWTQEDVKTVRVMCDVFEDDALAYEASPRNILKKVVDEAREMGYEFLVGPELEFFFLEKYSNTQTIIPADQEKYFASEINAGFYDFKRQLFNALLAQGIKVEKMHHEVAPGQHEISIRYGSAVDIADQVLIAKHTIKTYALNHGLQATFMPKPIYGMSGSAMHVHFSLYDKQKRENVFFDANDKDLLSPIARHFIAGVLKHIKELTALMNPTVNSYKRLVPGYEAPTKICWAPKNRSTIIRIPLVGEDRPEAVRAELRSPDPLSNPYLVFAAILKAGLTGIKNKYELPKAVTENLYHMNLVDIKNRGIESLPTSLGEALDILRTSELAQDLLGARLFEQFISSKMKEVYRYNTDITDWELKNYC
jgi:glutamine synthetase